MGAYGEAPSFESIRKAYKKRLNKLAIELNIDGVDCEVLLEIVNSCGVKAIMSLLDVNSYDWFLKELMEKDKSHCINLINAINSKGLGIEDIIKTVLIFNDNYSDGSGRNLVPDMRYNSHLRDVTGSIFQTGHQGIAAFKFTNTNNSHWIFFGQPGINLNMDKLKERDPKLDGVGHVVVFKHKRDIQAIANTHTNSCDKSMCYVCCRSKFCFERLID
uniref:Uncharacterized protein n=1 Tax=viral metagenome TaxID=1070528 RepID=A0A6M3Y570_9ZZZZ